MPRRAVPAAASELAALARVLADPSRAAMLDLLLDGAAHPIGALAAHAEVSLATASSHVRQLADARLVTVTPAGRARHVALASAEVAELLERLAALTAPPVPATATARAHHAELRAARTCYDHLAGTVAILLRDALVARGWIAPEAAGFAPAPPLLAWLAARGHAVDGTSRRPLVRGCLDWTERVPHLAGQVGAALAAVFLDERWAVRVRGRRALRLTDRGRVALARELDVVIVHRRGTPTSRAPG